MDVRGASGVDLFNPEDESVLGVVRRSEASASKLCCTAGCEDRESELEL